VRRRDHAEGAAQLRSRREHGSTLVFDFVVTCQHCGAENPEGARFCNACGSTLEEPVHVGEERRIVSVLFVDLVAFTSRSEQLDPEDVRAFLTPYHDRVRTEIERLGGVVEKFVGDAVMGLFGAPTAHGDDAERAVRAALAIRDWAEDDGLQVRIAVNTGEAIVALDANPARGEAMVAGDVVNTAARLQSAAPVGSVIVGDQTYASTRAAVDYRPAPPVVAKGKSLPVRAWVAVEPIMAAGERPLSRSPMIGRDRELSVLESTWERVVEERRPRLVTVFGPAGIGKSRLALEFAQHVASHGARALRGRSMPYGESSTYSAFAQHVKQIAGVFDSDEPADAQAKLSVALEELVGIDAEGAEHARHLAMLLGLHGDDEAPDRDTLFFSARVLVESVAAREPTLLVFEDIHWADASLLDLLETLAARLHDVPVLLLALARPEMLTDRPTWGGGLPAYTALPLEPLAEDDASELAARLLTGNDVLVRQAAGVAQTSEGNPLFIEELAASLAERTETNGGELPTSIREIVAARLDALPQAERSVLLDAAVVGRVFWRGALVSMEPRGDLQALLGSLEQRDFVRREAISRIQGDQQFAFKHALICDVAYQTLPRAARRERHAAVASYLEETTGAGGQANEALAHHWGEAGEPRRALDCLLVAAEQAGRGWAKAHALALYSAALRLVPEEDRELRRQIRLRQAVTAQAFGHLIQEDVARPERG
jgi:class 3 adenylate cyclase